MNRADALDKILLSYRRYYDIKKEGVKPPFIAEAAFASHNEQYYLVKAAKVADVDSYEYVYIASDERLTLSKLMELDKASWEDGMSKLSFARIAYNRQGQSLKKLFGNKFFN